MLGLGLEGGGAKGAFHIGALKALFERGFQFAGVAGTSIGALNGAMVAQGDFDKCYDFWQTVTPSTLLDIDDAKIDSIFSDAKIQVKEIPYFIGLAKTAITNKGISIQRLEDIVNNLIIEDKIRKSNIDFGIITVDITSDWLPIEIFKDQMPAGMLKKYVLASAYYPAFRRPRIDGRVFIDGGIYDNCPVNPLIRRGGYKKIIVISTLSKMPARRVADKSVKVDYIIPSKPLGNTLDLRNKNILGNLKLGYYDAVRYLDNLMGEKFYFKNVTNSYVYNLIESQQSNFFVNLSTLFSEKGNKKALTTRLFKEMKGFLKLDKALNDAEVFLKTIEFLADDNKIEKFQIYSIETFLKEMEISDKYKKNTINPVVQAIQLLINAYRS
jgi:NTE family protein